jgi:hypothetical protein
MNADDILTTFPPGDRILPVMLQRQARHHGSRTLFICGGASWHFDEVPDIAARFAGTLAAAGIDRSFSKPILAAPGSAQSQYPSMLPRVGRSFGTS